MAINEDSNLWADRGRRFQIETEDTFSPVALMVASRHGSLQFSARRLSIWVQLRGMSRVDSLEGRFCLRKGDWMVFDRDSRPNIHTSLDGLCMGVSLDGRLFGRPLVSAGERLYPGRGRLRSSDRLIFLRLWRNTLRLSQSRNAGTADFRSLLAYLTALQQDLDVRLRRCPGRTRSHQIQIFHRLQRTRLYLRGHRHRIVRMSELADLANFSNCYFSRTYSQVYEERPQTTATRLRLEHAADLLRGTECPIGEIALSAGFENACSFSRAFRGHFGISATDYRKQDHR